MLRQYPSARRGCTLSRSMLCNPRASVAQNPPFHEGAPGDFALSRVSPMPEEKGYTFGMGRPGLAATSSPCLKRRGTPSAWHDVAVLGSWTELAPPLPAQAAELRRAQRENAPESSQGHTHTHRGETQTQTQVLLPRFKVLLQGVRSSVVAAMLPALAAVTIRLQRSLHARIAGPRSRP